MPILEALGSIVTTILIGYLSLTNSIAHSIEAFITPQEITPITTESQLLKVTVPSEPSEKLSLFSRTVARATSIPKILRDNSAFQEAALIASTDVTSDIPKTVTNETIEHALVNIFCQYKTDEYIRTTTGTGFFINKKGVLLTNAHVAQFLLLEHVDDSVIDAECVVRTGNPAEPKYAAELLFISPTWILNNAKLIMDEAPRGTGESDYALLYVHKALGTDALPDTFPTLHTYTDFLSKSLTGASVFSAGYPAEKLFREGARAKLTPVVATTTIGELYTFGSNYADIFEISGSSVGEQGSSGGPIVHTEKGALGLIVTKGSDAGGLEKSLRALSLSYIDRTITEETGFTLMQNTQGNLEYRAEVFKKALIPYLSTLLKTEIIEHSN